MFPYIEVEGKSGLITANRMEPGDIGVLVEAPRGGGDCGGICDWNWEDSPGLEVLVYLRGGELSTGLV